MRWDLFCTVVDNYGDIGVCWRLARQLADEYGATIRLWVDDLHSFACLCPAIDPDASMQQVGAIEIRHWPRDFPTVDAADVVIEAFACVIPEVYVAEMARRAVAPVWINLEYLSAETWVDDCHLLASPHPRWPLTKTFFFPGFTPRTGGLLKERDLQGTRAAFHPDAAAEFRRSLGIAPDSTDSQPGSSNRPLWISLFCYENPSLTSLLECWASGPRPVRLLATPGPATDQCARWFGTALAPGGSLRNGCLTVNALPFLPQDSYDRLLWSCDVNFVRGEDSFVRAQWAQQPFVWQIYPQAENAHLAKLEAFLARYLGQFAEPGVVRRCWRAWNGAGEMVPAWQEFVVNHQSVLEHGKVWVSQLDHAGNLANNLARFVRGTLTSIG